MTRDQDRKDAEHAVKIQGLIQKGHQDSQLFAERIKAAANKTASTAAINGTGAEGGLFAGTEETGETAASTRLQQFQSGKYEGNFETWADAQGYFRHAAAGMGAPLETGEAAIIAARMMSGKGGYERTSDPNLIMAEIHRIALERVATMSETALGGEYLKFPVFNADGSSAGRMTPKEYKTAQDAGKGVYNAADLAALEPEEPEVFEVFNADGSSAGEMTADEYEAAQTAGTAVYNAADWAALESEGEEEVEEVKPLFVPSTVLPSERAALSEATFTPEGALKAPLQPGQTLQDILAQTATPMPTWDFPEAKEAPSFTTLQDSSAAAMMQAAVSGGEVIPAGGTLAGSSRPVPSGSLGYEYSGEELGRRAKFEEAPMFSKKGLADPTYGLRYAFDPDVFAEGGVTDTDVALVGEKGPELAMFPVGTHILPLGKANPADIKRAQMKGKAYQQGGIVFGELPFGLRQLQAGRPITPSRGYLSQAAGLALPSAQALSNITPESRDVFFDLAQQAGIPSRAFGQELQTAIPRGTRLPTSRMLPLGRRGVR
jgi:hypothetical protein